VVSDTASEPVDVRSSLPPDPSSVHLFTSDGGGQWPAGRYKYFPGGRGGGRSSRAGQIWPIFLLYYALLFLNAAADSTHRSGS
jgi:hypothetical protein